MILALLHACTTTLPSPPNLLLNISPSERLSTPAYGATLYIDLIKNNESIGPDGGCAAATQADIASVYTLGERLVRDGLPTGATVTEKVILKTPDRVILQNTVHARDGSPLIIQRNYLDKDAARCGEVLYQSGVLFAGPDAGKAVWQYWDQIR